MLKFLSCFIATSLFLGPCFAATPKEAVAAKATAPQVTSFENFTGKVLKNRVRMRCRPSLEGHIVQELKKNDYLLVTGQEGDFWIVAPLPQMKFSVFRSYIIDNTVEANRVNIRLSPDTESPIVGQLMHGDHVEGEVSTSDHKWLEITPPSSVHFFVAKEFVEKVGDQEFFSKIQSRKEEADALLQSATSLAQAECKKSFQEMNLDEATQKFETILQAYSDFPEHIKQAKDGLALLQDSYLQKKSTTSEQSSSDVAQHPVKGSVAKSSVVEKPHVAKKENSISSKMSSWVSAELALYGSWQQLNSNKDLDQFYKEQEVNGITLSGIVEPYDILLKDRPGDYLLKSDSVPVAFLYSTKVDLSAYVGKRVTIKASSRPNNNFAFPAYFVTSLEK